MSTLKKLNAVELLALSKVKADRKSIAPGHYEGTFLVEISYDVTVGDNTTVSKRKGDVGTQDVLMMALAVMTAEQREELVSRMKTVATKKGVARTQELGMNCSTASSKWMDAHYPLTESARAGSVKASVNASTVEIVITSSDIVAIAGAA